MLFNSFEFAIFFLITFALYRTLPHKGQNVLLLVASYIFYASWDWRFLSLILFCTVVSYGVAAMILRSSSPVRRRLWLIIGLVADLGVLGFFKYYNFFIENLQQLLGLFHIQAPWHVMKIILPMGISFFTFQAMSYTIDIYRKALKPTGTFMDFALYVSFFPQLVAGPIERATHLLPQMVKPRQITRQGLRHGAYLIFLGLFQKLFVADNLATIVNPVFADPHAYGGMDMLIAMYAFTLQIFCDFAGYSNIARGLGATMGFDIMVNFNTPFFAVNVQEFWNRWHISLSQWIRDYLYFPLIGGLRKLPGNVRIYAALLISMTLMGLWHGASWNFVIFGVYYGALLVLHIIIRQRFSRLIAPRSEIGQRIWIWVRIILIFQITAFGMMLFRSTSLAHAGEIVSRLWSGASTAPGVHWAMLGKFLGFATPIMLLQYGAFRTKDIFFIINRPHWLIRVLVLAFMSYLVLGWGVMSSEEFIYFQF